MGPITKTKAIPAKQARAQRTMERVEAAARAALNQESWADLTMAALARAAKTSVGSIYARFPSKEALLDRLDEIYCEEIIALNTALSDDPKLTSFDDAMSTFVRDLARYHRAHAGLIRTLILETRTAGHPAFHERSDRMNKALKGVARRLGALAEAEGRTFPADKISWVLFLVLSTMRELALFSQGLPRPKVGFAKGEAEIIEMAQGYLARMEGKS